jgi:type I restriction enzyme S subunit
VKSHKKNGWVPRKLNELGFVGRGKSRHRPRNAPELYGGPYPFFQTGDIKAAELYLIKYTQTYSDAGLAQSKLWNPGTLCITIAANIADTAIMGINGCFPDSVVGFIADPMMADVRFVKYYIDTIKLAMQNVSKGTTQDNLSLDKLLMFDFLAPDVVGQRKIASILTAYDDLIENNARRIAILEAMTQAIYREWFVEFRFPGHEKVKLVDSPLGKIPCDWNCVELTEHGFVGRGKSRHRPRNEPALYGGPFPFFQTGEIKEAKVFLWKYSQTYSEAGLAQSKQWEPGTLCITIAANIAETAILARKACFPDSVVGFIPNLNKSDAFYIKMFLDSIKQQMQNASRGTTQDNLSLEKLLRFQIPTPPFSQLLRFREQVTPIFDELLVLSKKNDLLRSIRDLLLPKLISGQLDVEDLDIETYEEPIETSA